MKKLTIRKEFTTGNRKPELEIYTVSHSKTNVQLVTHDIDQIVSSSPYEVGSIPFCRYFFNSILGDNLVFPNYYYGSTGRPAYFMKEVSEFLEAFTNIAELETEVQQLFDSIKEPISTYEDTETINKILIVHVHRKQSKGKKGGKEEERGALFGKMVTLCDGKVLFIESLDFKDMGYPSKKTNRIFFKTSDIAEMVKYYRSVLRSR